jgi:Ca-activated chloride channel family protein
MKTVSLWIACLVLGIAGQGVCEVEEEESRTKTLAPYFFVEEGDPSVDRIPLKKTEVDVTVSGVIANVRVVQVYENRGKRPINARYIFPASIRAAVHEMKMRIGEHVIFAKIKEREAAKAEYVKAVQAGKSASLLEQSRPNVFSMSVGNILPSDVVNVEISYTELLVPEEGVYEFVFPTVVGPRYSRDSAQGAPDEDRFVEHPYLKESVASQTDFDILLALNAGMPIRDLECPTHRARIERKGMTNAIVRLDPDEREGGNRDFILRYKLAGARIESGVLLYQGAAESFFLVMAQPPDRVSPSDIPAREYVFVVDVSGSMHGFPLEISKELLKNLIGSLRPTDTFNVVLFSGASRLMSKRSLPANPDNIAEAIRVIDGQRGGGGTELHAAMVSALSIPRERNVSRSIVLVTDGYISAERDVFDLVARNLGNTNFFAFGIGSSVNRYLIEGVARAGLGEPFVITDPGHASATADRFRRYIRSPVLTGITVDFDGFDAYDVEPSGHPDLLAERPLVAFGKWRGGKTGKIVIRGVTGRGLYQQIMDVSSAQSSMENSALRYLWARSRIAILSDYGVGDAPEENRGEIVDLGLKYNLLTAFTSFVAVHEIVRITEGSATDVKQPLPLPQGVSNLAVGGVGMTRGSEPELALVLLTLAFLILPIRFRRHRAVVPNPGVIQ